MDGQDLQIGDLPRWVILGSLLLMFGVRAETFPPPEQRKTLTRSQCILTALASNRDLQIERLNPEVVGAAVSVAYGAYDPVWSGEGRWENASDSGGFDPTDFSRDAIYDATSDVARIGLSGLFTSGLTYSVTADYANSLGNRNFMDFDSYKVAAGITLRQPLLKNLWIDQARYAIKISRRNQSISELGVRFMVMDVVNKVERAYFELRQAYDQLALRERMRQSRRQLLHATQRQLEGGRATRPDVELARAQLAATEASIGKLRADLALAENELRTQLGDSFTNQVREALFPSEELPWPTMTQGLEECWRRGLVQRPDLLQFKQELAKADLNVRYWRNQSLPSLDLVGSYGRKGASVAQTLPPLRPDASAGDAMEQLARGVAPSDMIGLMFSVPLTRTAERAQQRASRLLREQTELRAKQKEELVLREISDAFYTALANREQADAAQRGLASARAACDAEERRLTGGKGTLFLVLQMQDQLIDLESLSIRSLADYNRALSQLAFADASSLEQAHIRTEHPPSH